MFSQMRASLELRRYWFLWACIVWSTINLLGEADCLKFWKQFGCLPWNLALYHSLRSSDGILDQQDSTREHTLLESYFLYKRIPPFPFFFCKHSYRLRPILWNNNKAHCIMCYMEVNYFCVSSFGILALTLIMMVLVQGKMVHLSVMICI